MTVFPGEPIHPSSRPGPPPVPEQNVWVLVECQFLRAGCLSCHRTISD